MARYMAAEEAILLASDNAAVADYLVRRGESKNGRFSDNISEETEAALLERNDRLVDLRLAEYCFYSSTATALLHRDPNDWALRSLVLSNQKIAPLLILRSFPECLFGNDEGLREYLSGISPDDAVVLFSNPTIGDRFLEEVLGLGDCWHAMPERTRLFALSGLADNPKLQKAVDDEDHDDGWGWHMAGKPFNAAWRLVIALDANEANARHLSRLYDRLARYCLESDGILDALPKWIPQSDAERDLERKDNKLGYLSSYQTIRRAAAAMLLSEHELEQGRLLDSDDSAIRCGAYLVARFTPAEMESAIERDGWIAIVSLMQNPNCWRTSNHRDTLYDGINADSDTTSDNEPTLDYRDYRRWENKFAADHPQWFDSEKVDVAPIDKPLTESSARDLLGHVATSPALTSISTKLERFAQAQRIHFWLLATILAVLLFRP